MSKPAKADLKRVIAITGTSGFVGESLLATLRQRFKNFRLIAIDKQPPKIKLTGKNKFYQVDLTAPHTDQTLIDIFNKENCDTLIHAAVLTQPPRDLDASHELQSVGTMYLVNAAAATDVRKLILVSTTDVYGAFPDNPNFLTEDHPTRGKKLSPFLKDKIDVEEQFIGFAKKYPDRVTTLLRLATIVGPTVHNFKTNFFQNAIIPSVLGFDPLIQFVHESDVIRAFVKVIQENHPGIFNIVGEGVLPLSRATHLAGKITLPIPSPILYPAAELLWVMDVGPAPSGHVNFLKYLCVADGTKAQKQIGFQPVYSSQEALMSFLAKEK